MKLAAESGVPTSKPASVVLGFLDRLLQAAENGACNGSVIELSMLQALAPRARGDMDAALVPLGQALVLAEPQGYMRLFVDEGEPMVALLKAAIKQRVAPNYARKLLAAFGAPEPKPPTHPDLLEPPQRTRAGCAPAAPQRYGWSGNRAGTHGLSEHSSNPHKKHLREAGRKQSPFCRAPRRRTQLATALQSLAPARPCDWSWAGTSTPNSIICPRSPHVMRWANHIDGHEGTQRTGRSRRPEHLRWSRRCAEEPRRFQTLRPISPSSTFRRFRSQQDEIRWCRWNGIRGVQLEADVPGCLHVVRASCAFQRPAQRAWAISQKMLSASLKLLDQQGLVERRHYPSIPPRVEYNLTEIGEELIARLLPLEVLIAEARIRAGHPGTMNIGAFMPIYGALGACYLLGGLLFGIATVRAAVLPRWPGIMLAGAAIITPAAALLPHALQRYAAVPMGIAMIWLGYSLWSERRRDKASTAAPAMGVAETGLGQPAR